MTVTISDTSGGKQPGDHDPSIPQAISDYNIHFNRNINLHNSPEALQSKWDVQTWSDVATRMGQRDSSPW